jgi:hypothetical protein
MTGPSLGGGIGVQTWQPFLCLFPRLEHSSGSTQLVTLAAGLLLAVLSAKVSLHLTHRIWRAKCNNDEFKTRCGIAGLFMFLSALPAALRAVNFSNNQYSVTGSIVGQCLVGCVAIVSFVSPPVATDEETQEHEPLNNVFFLYLELGCRLAGLFPYALAVVLIKRVEQGKDNGTEHPAVVAIVIGYKPRSYRFLFEAVCLLRKWALIVIAAVVNDAFLASLIGLGTTGVVWWVNTRWKPFQRQMLIRTAFCFEFTLHVRGESRLCMLLCSFVLRERNQTDDGL